MKRALWFVAQLALIALASMAGGIAARLLLSVAG